MLKIKFIAAIIFAIIFVNGAAFAQENMPSLETNWYWLSSNKKYSKFIAPETVVVLRRAQTRDGRDIPTEIEAWTKTTYTFDGAKETIKNYNIASILPDPKKLSYSLALLKINPQNRTLQYLREDFFDGADRVIWSKGEGRIKEINSQSFDEDFYAAAVDEVFNLGELDRKGAKDRWIELWTFTNTKTGDTTTVTGDTTTMRMRGANLILWQWQETKNSKGQISEIRFTKKTVNLSQGTERIAAGSVWNLSTRRWSEFNDESGGIYRMIKNDEPDYKGLIRLRAFVKGYPNWVHRYEIF